MKPAATTPGARFRALGQAILVLVLGSGLAAILWLRAQPHGPSEAASAAGLSTVSWLLVVAGIVGTALAGRGCRFGWLLLFGLQPVWIAYAVITDQNGLVLGCLAYAGGQLHGFLRGGRREV